MTDIRALAERVLFDDTNEVFVLSDARLLSRALLITLRALTEVRVAASLGHAFMAADLASQEIEKLGEL